MIVAETDVLKIFPEKRFQYQSISIKGADQKVTKRTTKLLLRVMLTDPIALSTPGILGMDIVNCRSVTPAGAGHGCGSFSSFDHSRILSHVSFTSLKRSFFLFKTCYRQSKVTRSIQAVPMWFLHFQTKFAVFVQLLL